MQYLVISSGPYGYSGFSSKLAEEMYDACARAGMNVCLNEKVDGEWVEVKEHLSF